MLREIGQTQKNKYCMISYAGTKKAELIELDCRMVVAKLDNKLFVNINK